MPDEMHPIDPAERGHRAVQQSVALGVAEAADGNLIAADPLPVTHMGNVGPWRGNLQRERACNNAILYGCGGGGNFLGK